MFFFLSISDILYFYYYFFFVCLFLVAKFLFSYFKRQKILFSRIREKDDKEKLEDLTDRERERERKVRQKKKDYNKIYSFFFMINFLFF